MQKLSINHHFKTQSEQLIEWVLDNLDKLKEVTGIDFKGDTRIEVEDGVILKDKILNRDILLKIDFEESNYTDLGSLVVNVSLCEVDVVVWIVSDIDKDTKQAFEWLSKTLREDIECHLIELDF